MSDIREKNKEDNLYHCIHCDKTYKTYKPFFTHEQKCIITNEVLTTNISHEEPPTNCSFNDTATITMREHQDIVRKLEEKNTELANLFILAFNLNTKIIERLELYEKVELTDESIDSI